MILKNLELTGFKSFVDCTRLDFTKGFTAVVGPNGCGKSNISDAIRWVIGEQSSKSLRGTRITDLIFNGSQSRKPFNRAEITMTLGDVPQGLRIANIQNLSEDITVTRCYHRSGESEFYINKIPCRLKDITDLFLDIGISPKVLTVIEQGHIQDIVTSKPEDRRIWIEEAAGVLKFKVRKNEALRKLEAAGQNLDRISDLIQELGRQVESLKRQAAKAERYKRFQSEIKELSLSLFSKRYRRSETELAAVEADLKIKNEQKTQWAARSATLENQIVELKIKIDERVDALNQQRETVHRLSADISRNEHDIDLKNAQVEQAQKDLEAAGLEVARMNEEIASHHREAESQKSELEKVTAEIHSQEEGRAEKDRAREYGKSALTELEEQLEESESQLLGLQQRISQKKNELTALATRQQFLQDRQGKLDRERVGVQEETEAVRALVDQAQELYHQNSRSFEVRQTERVQVQNQTAETKERFKIREEQFQSAREVYSEQSSLLNSLRKLRKKFEGFDDGVKALMNGANEEGGGKRPTGLREVLVDVVHAPAEFEKALEAVMGDKLQSVIVNSYDDSIAAIRYLNENRSGRGSFVPLQPKSVPMGPLHLNGNPDIVGKLLDFIQTPDEYRPVFEHLLDHVVVVRNLETAMYLHAKDDFHGTVVTLNGEVIDAQGVVSGGARGDDTLGLLAQNRKIEELTDQVEALHQELQYCDGEKQKAAAELAGLETTGESLGSAVHEAEIARAQSLKDLEQSQKDLQRLQEKTEILNMEQSSGRQELEELSLHHETLNYECLAAGQELGDAETRQTEQRQAVIARRADLEQQTAVISALNVGIAELKGRQENISLEIKGLALRQENLTHRIEQRQTASRNNSLKIEECREAIGVIEKNILELARRKDGLSEEISRAEEILREKEETLDTEEQESRQLGKRVQEITEGIAQVELQRSEKKMQMVHVEERAWEDFNVPLEEMLKHFSTEIDEDEVAAQVTELKAKIAKLGEVNLAALSDYQQTNERFLFLQKQQEDLAESIMALHRTIDKIDKTTTKLFQDTFDQVNEQFKGMFARLFQGGKAELSLVDPDNPLESGIEITASPLGKKMHNITLLSGGEKTMTAIALIFSILKVRPSPFCLLDEVDAPLDEANVIRFQELLKEMSANTQFIIITHNQKTMSFANTLYGVTMEEQGVSKVVSVTLN